MGRLLFILLACCLATAQAQLQPFQAIYTAAYQGSEVGEGVLTLDIDQQQYRLELKIEPTGLLSLIPFSIQEHARGLIENNSISPREYSYQRSGLGKTRSEKIMFSSQYIQRDNKGQLSNLPFDAAIDDPLSLILQVMNDLRANQLKSSYRMLNRGKIKDYHIQDQGTTTLATALGNKPARQIQRGDDADKLQFWFGSNTGFVPLRIIQFDDGEEEISLHIRSLLPR